jgi:hypothetical protein
VVDYGLGEYYVEIVTALGEDAFLLDTGKTVYGGGGKSFEPEDRVYLNFSYQEESSNQITIHSSAKISKGNLNAVKETGIPEYANDPIRFESAWIGSHYLNLRFYMEYKSEIHKIALITDSVRVNNPEIDIFFRHDKNKDKPGYFTPVYVSFDLKEVLGEPRGDRTLRVNFNTTNYGDKTYAFKY